MPFKKFEHESERVNEFEHAKIIAIVNNDGVIQGYDYTLTQDANDFFADPEDRKKYGAITVRLVACESLDELKEKFRVAEKYLRWGAILTTPESQADMKRLNSVGCSVDRWWNVNDNGMIDDPLITPDSWKIAPSHFCNASPLAHGERWNTNYHFRVINNKIREADYKIEDVVELRDEAGKIDVVIVARHNETWVNSESGKAYTEHLFFGRFGKELVRFRPKNVISHKKSMRCLVECMIRKQKMTQAEYAAWLASSDSESESESDSESDNDDPVPVLGGILPYRMTIPYSGRRSGMTNCMMKVMEKIKLEQQSDASPPESEPKPEQSDEAAAAPAPEEAPAEQIVPPPALTLRRRCDRPGWKPRQ